MTEVWNEETQQLEKAHTMFARGALTYGEYAAIVLKHVRMHTNRLTRENAADKGDIIKTIVDKYLIDPV